MRLAIMLAALLVFLYAFVSIYENAHPSTGVYLSCEDALDYYQRTTTEYGLHVYPNAAQYGLNYCLTHVKNPLRYTL